MDELLQRLIDALLELIEQGENIPDEVLEEVTAILLARMEQITSSKSSAGNIPVSTSSSVPQADFPSSNIFGFNYDPASQTMKVKFMGKDTADSGPVYEYSGVGQNTFNIIKRGSVAPRTSGKNRWHTWKKGQSPSHGASVYALLREGGHPYKKVA